MRYGNFAEMTGKLFLQNFDTFKQLFESRESFFQFLSIRAWNFQTCSSVILHDFSLSRSQQTSDSFP